MVVITFFSIVGVFIVEVYSPVKPRSLLRTVRFVPGKKSPYIFSKFNLLSANTVYGPSVSL